MLALKYLLMILGAGLFGSAGALVVYDIYISEHLRRLLARSRSVLLRKRLTVSLL